MTAPIRARAVRVARLDGDWTDAGGLGAVTFQPLLEAALDRYAETVRLPIGATITVAFHPTRAMRRVLFGWAATVDRTRIRRAYRARARRRSS